MTAEKILPPDGGPAFPRPMTYGRDAVIDDGEMGMSLRDYFAARVMQGIVSSVLSEEDHERLVGVAHLNGCQKVSEWIAKDSYKQADAMLKARQR